ncbi:4-diphosphocytidyl-2C-methyl-D-erythritol kinase [Roseovarius atlanticus]|uniref:4-diphosphocytidyl-2-C-methyl-D-erythritol kinase n=1 Tax=Roseovarius atlanticus TaxID=1641875 RepID=A0A0T5NYF6_9RHOB|nr:4-(cytidine 5'-diphospho)-2-C-methyl-D-erythritol kinase [Roseovarius atlanticus]KRS13925.1 4-diphosphocytidyl-2C-methyl-D-erythritol kinase [Roseovarius atlanticus]
MTAAEGFAPAKINLTLHITGQRDDGMHLLDSLVMFADVGDHLTVALSDTPRLSVTGPMARGVPEDESNLVLRAAQLMGVSADITLDKQLPHAAGVGGGSSDAAATLRVLSRLIDTPIPDDVTPLGADVPICLGNGAARMQGIGEKIVAAHDLPCLHAVLINPGVPMRTFDVFAALVQKNNTPMPGEVPANLGAIEFIDWLRGMRNDLEYPAIAMAPAISQVLGALSVTAGCRLARMTGSGSSCFGLYTGEETARAAEGRLKEENPGWWITATRLNAHP